MGFNQPKETVVGFNSRGIYVSSARYHWSEGKRIGLISSGRIDFEAEDETEVESILRQNGANRVVFRPINRR